MSIQKQSKQQPTVFQPLTTSDMLYCNKLWSRRTTTNNANTDPTSSSTRNSRRLPKALHAMHVQHLGQPSSYPSPALSSPLSVLSVKPNSGDVCYDLGHFASKCPLLANQRLAPVATIFSANMQKPTHIC